MRNVLLLFFCVLATSLVGQPTCHVTYYDEEDGLPHSHVTQIVEDELGFMWFATWNGLCRYDGYEFHTFKSSVGDGCRMATDRFRDIALRPDGKIICRVDDDYFLFDPRECRFCNLTDEESRQAAADIRRHRRSVAVASDDGSVRFAYTDSRGIRWETTDGGVVRLAPDEPTTERLDIEPRNEVKCLFADSRGRVWIATKGDAAVRVYDAKGSLQGYLDADGRINPQYASFGMPVYTIYESTGGTLWLGTKPNGLLRLHEVSDGHFSVKHVDGLPATSVYSVVEDNRRRLWVATLDAGLFCTDDHEATHPVFRRPQNYPTEAGQRLRFLHLVRQGTILVGAATDGLVVARLDEDADRMRFDLHRREAERSESLTSSATMDAVEDAAGRLYISTESGGVNRLMSDNVLAEVLQFDHLTASDYRLPTDVVMSLTAMPDSGLMVVGSHLITLLDGEGHKRRVLDAAFFGRDYRFSDAHPLALGDGRWLFGLADGAVATTMQQMLKPARTPRVVLTGISIQGSGYDWAVAYADTIRLAPTERNITVRFAALDYLAADRTNYAFRLLPDGQWNDIGRARSATLLDLEPGIYDLELRSTDADGSTDDGMRRLTIVVQPTFWESVWGRMLAVMLLVVLLYVTVHTILYIRRIKRKQHETLEAYLSLLNKANLHAAIDSVPAARAQLKGEDDATMKRIMAFIEENIGNSDVSVGDMAAAASTSRSGLQRKLKQTIGVTPQELLREARIKHACRLLRESEMTVAEVAYASGFTDPKYFSRCFKQSTGQSPSDYKNT